MSDLIGRVIDNYRIDAVLGDGGMGTVYRAYDVNLDRPVAIKVMHSHFARRPAFRARLRQEAKSAASLDHPSLVRILDYGESDGLAYIVMEYVSGGSLRAHLQRLQEQGKFLPLEQSLQIGFQMADALHYAHERGLIHRDVKPSNIILKRLSRPEEPGEQPFRAVLTDFGLVKLLEGEALTESGTTLGTPAYMSPEQCEGLELEGRSDLYSLGVVLYELLTNRLPFQFNSLAEAIATHMRGEMPTPVRVLRPEVPAVVDAIVSKALAKAPSDRFLNGEAMAAAFRSAMFSLSDAPTRVLREADEEGEAARRSVAATEGEREAPEGYYLTIKTPGYEPVQVVLARPVISLGRDAENDIVLPAEGVSRFHARLQAMDDGWLVVDLGGVNGTRLNGRSLPPSQATRLEPDDRLKIGPYELILEGPPAQPRGEMVTPMPVVEPSTPGPAAAAPLSVHVARDKVAVEAGGRAEFHVEIVNRGEVDDRVTLTVEGLPESWVSGPEQFIAVPAGEAVGATVVIRPPRETATPAGRQRFRFALRSQQYPEARPDASASLLLGTFEAFEASLNPAEVRLPDVVKVVVRNTGNSPLDFTVAASDPAQKVEFHGAPQTLRLEPRQRATVELELTSRRPNLFSAAEAYPFTVEISTTRGAREGLAGEAEIPPLIPPWLSYGGLVIIVFLCVFSLLFLLLGDRIWGPSSAEATAAAGTSTAVAAADLQTIVAATATINAATQAAITPTSTGDRDNDGLSDEQEAVLGTLVDDPDSDDDGLPDGMEVLELGCSPLKRDTDDDFLNDWDEVNLYGTECNDADTDDDGLTDGVEITQGTDPLSPPAATATASATPSPTGTPGPTATASPTPTPSQTPTPSLTPSATATNAPTATPTPTSTPAPSATPTRTPTPTQTAAPTATSTPTTIPSPTATPPSLACFATPPTIDGELTDGIWAFSQAFTFDSPTNSGRQVTVYMAETEENLYLAFVVQGPQEALANSLSLYLDTNYNGGDPDSADWLLTFQPDGGVLVERGLGDNSDGRTWERVEEVPMAAAMATPTPSEWIIELAIDSEALGGFDDPFGMSLVLDAGAETLVWPEEADPTDLETWGPVENPPCSP